MSLRIRIVTDGGLRQRNGVNRPSQLYTTGNAAAL